MRYRSLLLTLLLLFAAAARAEPGGDVPAEPAPPSTGRLLASMGAGLGTALVPLAAGGAWLGASERRQDRHGALYLMAGGLALAPVVSHVVAGEHRRAGLFGIVPVLSAVGLRALLAAQPDLALEGTTEGRVGFIVLLSLTVVSSTVGLIDSLRAGERQRRARALGRPLGKARTR